MDILLSIPENIAERLEPYRDKLTQLAIERIAVEAYRDRLLTAAEVQQLLNLPSQLATDALLKQHHAYLPHSLEDIQQDITSIDQALSNS